MVPIFMGGLMAEVSDLAQLRAELRQAFWRGFLRGAVKAVILCALVGLLAWPWLVKVA